MTKKYSAENNGLKFSILIIFIIALTLILIGYQEVTRLYDTIQSNITKKLHENVGNINHILNSSENQLNLIGEIIVQNQHHQLASTVTEPNHLSEPSRYYFSIDENSEWVSLSGIGNFDKLNHDQLNQLAISQELLPYLKTSSESLPRMQWIYYISKEKFIYLYPPVKKDDYLFTEKTLEQDFYTLTLPEHNANRSIVMTNVYPDEAGAGLMITLSKPIYHHNEFLGSLSLDYTLVQIKKMIQTHGLKNGTFILFNENDEVLASSCSNEEMTAIIDLQESLEHFELDKKDLSTLNNDQFYDIDGHLIKTVGLPNHPWKLVNIRSMASIYTEMFVEELPLIILFISLIITVLLYLKKVRNDTEIMNSKLKFEQVVEQTVQLMAILDTKGNIIFVNQTARDMIGYKGEDLIGQPFSQSPWWSWSEEMIQFIEDAVIKTNQGLSVKKDVIHYDTEGNKHYVEFTMNPIYNKRGKIEYLAANGKDVTNRILLKESIDRLTKLDVLTNLSNRRGITETIQNEISRYNRTGDSFSILLLDIDYFKRVNDTYGHNVGDEVLLSLSQYLQQLVREYDVVGRWGGEEFLIVLPNTRYDEALELGKRIRKSIKTIEFSCMDQKYFNHITLTIGVTEFNFEFDINGIIKQADDALYYGKKHGRDQVVGYKDINAAI